MSIKDSIDIINNSPPDFKIVSIIGQLFNLQAFSEYSATINPELFQKFNFDDFENIINNDDKQFILLSSYLPLALMFKNQDMKKYIYGILEKAGYKESFDIFDKNIDSVNELATLSIQSGGAKPMDYLYALGAIFVAAFYNYYMYSIGSVRIINAVQRVQELAPLVRGACNTQYKPSHWVSLASRFTKDPSLIQNIEHIIQCSEIPTFFKSQIEEVENRRQMPLIMGNFKSKLIGMSEKLKELPAPSSQESANSRELVIYGTDFNEIQSKLTKQLEDEKGNILNNEQLVKRVKELAKLPPNELVLLIAPSLNASPSPGPSVAPTQKPLYEKTKEYVLDVADFASDIVGAIKDISPSGAVPSLDPKNIILWTLQDALRDLQRKIEDTQTETGRTAFDIVNELTRVGVDFASIPSVILYLIAVNTAALGAIIFFGKELFGSKPVRGQLLIEDAAPYIIEGGYRKRHSIHKLKRKTRKLKRNKNRKQTKGKKGRRFTRRH